MIDSAAFEQSFFLRPLEWRRAQIKKVEFARAQFWQVTEVGYTKNKIQVEYFMFYQC